MANDTCSTLVLLSSDPSPFDPSKDLDLPIALCKGSHTCRFTYSVANFVSYDLLSHGSWSLVTYVDYIFVPKTVKETESSRLV